MDYIGDFAEDATVQIYFTTNDSSGGAVAPSTAFEAADVVIYKDGSATQKATANGVTMTSPFDTTTGLHLVSIDTSNDTGDVGFWATGSDYTAVLAPDETVDSQTIVHAIGQFSIENRFMRGTDSAFLAASAPTNFSDLSITATTGRVDVASVEGSDATDQIRDALVDDATRFSGADIAAILADTNELQTDDVPGLIAALNDPAASAIADAIWDEAKAGHVGAGSFGEEVQAHSLSSEISGLNDPTAAAIRAEIDSNSTQLAAIVADTNELQTDDVPGLIAALNDLSAAEVNAEVDSAFTSQMADSVPADGTIATREQALYMILQFLTDFSISSTTLTVRKVDGSTALMTFTLNDDTNPTSLTRAT